MRLVELSRREHSGLLLDLGRVRATVANCHMVPLVVSEFRKAAISYPIVLAKSPETGQFMPFALMGLAPEENLFWDGHGLAGGYLPLNIRRLPFFVGAEAAETGRERLALCIDLESPAIVPTGGAPLVDAAGQEAAYFLEAQEVLKALVASRPRTQAFIASLIALGLIVEMTLDITLESGRPLVIKDLYCLDENRLDRLADADLVNFQRTGDLLLSHAMLLSRGHIQTLVTKRNQAEAVDREWVQ